ncbi:MAG: CRISPR-associated exonuclease Cas4 [Thermotogaceae bacterium]|jgi:CRISPR-associated exonuclease Cas4|nr:CRISPR-associated exonuclease Cas4 [Thermotogaceae bacterium]MDN5338199.1 CRISPR-associated exonuclease Cas4 [Thermotogaceae bacterium]
MVDDPITGYSVLAYVHCKREAWLVLRRFVPEQENPYIELGRFLHRNSYKNKGYKEVELPGAKIDLIWKENNCTIVGEIKKSTRSVDGARIQLLFYLKLLKEKGINATGQILIPQERKRLTVEYDEKAEEELQKVIDELRHLQYENKPPKPVWISKCSKCGFANFCWAGE